jgi:hypothetical protein
VINRWTVLNGFGFKNGVSVSLLTAHTGAWLHKHCSNRVPTAPYKGNKSMQQVSVCLFRLMVPTAADQQSSPASPVYLPKILSTCLYIRVWLYC